MTNFAIAFENRHDEATLSGGSYSGTLPLANSVDPQPGIVARTSDATLLSTQFDADLTQARILRMIAMVRHNASQGAKWRVRTSDESDFSTTDHDSGFVDMWPGQQPFGLEPWGVFTWGGKLTEAQAADFGPIAFVWIPDSVLSRYVRIEISDTSNSDGFFQFGRVYIGDVFRSTLNVVYGFENGYREDTTKTRSLGGVLYADARPKYRYMRFNYQDLSEEEAYSNVQEIHRIRGLSGDVLAVLDMDNARFRLRQSIYGQFSSVGAVIHTSFDAHAAEFEIEEML